MGYYIQLCAAYTSECTNIYLLLAFHGIQDIMYNYAVDTHLPRHTRHYVQVIIFIKSILRRLPDAEKKMNTLRLFTTIIRCRTHYLFFHNIYLPQTHTFSLNITVFAAKIQFYPLQSYTTNHYNACQYTSHSLFAAKIQIYPTNYIFIKYTFL